MIADIIIIAIMGLCVFFGYSRGLIKVGVRILSFVISIVIALVLYTPISNYIIENTDIVSNLQNTINSKMSGTEEKEEVNEIEKENTNIADMMGKYVEDYTDNIKNTATGAISEQVAIAAIRIGTWIGLFLVTKIGLIFISFLSDAIAEIPVIKQFNKARWNNLWNTRGICDNICITCSVKYGISDDRR